jgi:hypothetical protein
MATDPLRTLGKMGLTTTEDFQRKGFQVDLEMTNLDSAINGVNRTSPGTIPFADLQTWQAQNDEWHSYYQKNVVNPDWIPFQSTSDLDTWLTRIESWKSKLGKWAALSTNAQTRQIVSALPDSPATIEHRENPPSKGGVPTWLYLVLGTGLLASFGYSVASVARIGGR